MAIKSKLTIVDQISVSSPCPDESFEKNARVLDAGWYCNQCSKEVYDLKKMSRKEIAKLVKNKKGNFCAVVSRRQDGSLITKEPVSSTQSFLTAGLLIASTTLINTPANAQSERGDVAVPVQTENHQVGGISMPAEVGEVSVEPVPTQNPSSEQSNASEQTKPTSGPPVRESVGLVAVQKRGKVAINPK